MGELMDLVEQGWQAFESGDVDRMLDGFAPDAEFVMPGASVRGTDAIKPLLEAYLRAFPDMRHTVKQSVEGDGTLACELHIAGTHTGPLAGPDGELPASGRRVEWHSCDFVTLRDGKIVAWHAYFDQLAFLTQVGALPQPAPA